MFYRYTFFLLTFCSILNLSSQELPYTLVPNTSVEYAPLTNATALDTDGPWDDPQLEIPIGFEVALFGDLFDTFYLNGFVGGFLMSDATESPVIVPYGEDLTDRGYGTDQSLSPIVYKVDGTAPNRIFKIEWQNAGFFNEVINGSSESFVNFQLWIYETSGIIEFCYGPSNIASNDIFDTGSGPSVGFLQSANLSTLEIENGWFLTGEASAPEISPTAADPVTLIGLNQTPASGQLYNFQPLNVSAVHQEELAVEIELYPNPVVNQLQLQLDLADTPDQLDIYIFDMLGQQVYYQPLGQTVPSVVNIDMQPFPKGSYTIQVRDGKAQSSHIISKQ